MSRIIQPVVSPRGRVIVLTGATLWLIAAMVLSATPEGARASTNPAGKLRSVEEIPGAQAPLYKARVFTDPRGRLYLADRGTNTVIRVPDADDVRADVVFGREGSGPGEFMLPREVAVDSRDNVFVVDSRLQRILKFAPDGTFIDYVVAVGAQSIVIDSRDRLIVRPGHGDAMLDVYTSDLEWETGLLEKTDHAKNITPYGLLMAIDARDRLFLLDQSGVVPTLRVYDRDMALVREWEVDPPQLRQAVEERVAWMQARLPHRTVRVDGGILAMAVDPAGEHLVVGYLINPSPEVRYTRVAWYSADGTLEAVEDREEPILGQALLADGTLLESTAEALRILDAEISRPQ